MRLFKRGRTWWLGWSTNGQEHRISTKCTDRKAAQLFFARKQRELADPHHAASHAATVYSAAERFLREAQRSCNSPHTYAMYECKVGHLARLLGAVRLSELTHDAVLEYIAQRERETAVPHTIHREITALRLTLKSAARAGEFARDPKMVLPKYSARYTPRTRWLTADELIAVCSRLEPGRAAVLVFMVATGARLSEAFRAMREDITGEGIEIRGTKTVSSRRTVPHVSIFWPFMAYALAWSDGRTRLLRPWGNLRRDVANACARAGVPVFTANDLRRTSATWLVKRGAPLNLVARFMGHTSTMMLQKVYGQLDASDTRRLLEEHVAGRAA